MIPSQKRQYSKFCLFSSVLFCFLTFYPHHVNAYTEDQFMVDPKVAQELHRQIRRQSVKLVSNVMDFLDGAHAHDLERGQTQQQGNSDSNSGKKERIRPCRIGYVTDCVRVFVGVPPRNSSPRFFDASGNRVTNSPRQSRNKK